MKEEKVLIVDDNLDLAHALQLRLRASGYHVLLAQDGVSAVALARAHQPFAVLLDLHLQEEDGFGVMRELHSSPELTTLPVIIVSADCSPVTQHKVLDSGAHTFLEKPVNHRLLLQTLHDLRMRSQDLDSRG